MKTVVYIRYTRRGPITDTGIEVSPFVISRCLGEDWEKYQILHKDSGFGVIGGTAVFDDVETAIEACKVLNKCKDWRKIKRFGRLPSETNFSKDASFFEALKKSRNDVLREFLS